LRPVASPRKSSGEGTRADCPRYASDIYSLGCLLLELLTGDVPFFATADTPLRSFHLNAPAPSARSRRADVPAELDTLVSSMLVKDPGARPLAAGVYEALLPWTSTGPGPEDPGSAGPRDGGETRDPTRPFRWPLLAPVPSRRSACSRTASSGPATTRPYAETGKPGRALPQLRFYVQNAGTAVGGDEARKVLESRFVIAQLLAADGYPDEALAELQAVRPLLAEAFGPDSTQVRNLDRQAARLGAPR